MEEFDRIDAYGASSVLTDASEPKAELERQARSLVVDEC